ncbi:MAG: hypothetical protein ACYSTZ_07120 [Planctomycetota bacterium]|jgi:hypothetical protein
MEFLAAENAENWLFIAALVAGVLCKEKREDIRQGGRSIGRNRGTIGDLPIEISGTCLSVKTGNCLIDRNWRFCHYG